MDQQPATSSIISMVESVLRQAAQGPPVWQRQQIGFVDHRSASTGDLSMLSGTSIDSPSAFSEQRALSPGDDQYDGLNDNDNGSEDSPSSSDSGGCGSKKAGNARPNRDPMSHRIIEKRRRDRMNNCLTNLSKLIPSSYLKKGRGRIEKTEIIEMAIRYMRSMQEERKRLLTAAAAAAAVDQPKTEATSSSVKDEGESPSGHSVDVRNPLSASAATAALLSERYKQGFYDCIAETLRFLAGADGMIINESTKTHLLMHLRDYFSQLICDILGAPVIAQLLQISQAPSVLHSPQHSIRSRSLSFDHSLPPNGHHEDDQPLNMSLKKPRLDQPSHLRHILTDAKADPIEVRRPHVFRYAAELSKLSPVPEMKPSLPHSLGASGVSAASGSTHYPSSPSSDSQQSLSGSSGSSAGDSPPRVVSPCLSSSHHQLPAHVSHAGIPVFALHSSGMFYVPLTLAPSQIDPSSVHRLTSTMGACHPVTITVSFCNSPIIADCPLQQPALHEPDTTKN